MLIVATYFFAFMLYLLSFFDDDFLRLTRKYIFFLVFLFSFLLLAFLETTIDYSGYEKYYDDVATLTNYNFDILFNLSILMFKFFSIPFELFYHCVGLWNFILLVVITYTFFETERERIIFLLCYLSFAFLLKDLVQMRNSLAIKYFLLSLYFYFKDKKVPFFLLYLAAIFTHNSLFMFAPLFLIGKRVRVTFFILIIVYGLFVAFYFLDLLSSVLDMIPSTTGRVDDYLKMVSRELDGLSLFHFTRLCFYLFFFWAYLRKESDTMIQFLLLCIVLGYLIRVCFIDFSLLSGRLAENAFVLESVLLSHIICLPCKKFDRLFKYGFLLLYCAIYLYMIFNNTPFIDTYRNFLF